MFACDNQATDIVKAGEKALVELHGGELGGEGVWGDFTSFSTVKVISKTSLKDGEAAT